MRKHRSQRRRSEEMEIDLSPMIDCIFILLIFFIVTSVFVDDPGIEVEKPNVSGEALQQRKVVLIAISGENRIYFDGQELQIDQISHHLQQAIMDTETPLIIRADRRCSHGIFASVYSEAKRAGFKHVQFATAEQLPTG